MKKKQPKSGTTRPRRDAAARSEAAPPTAPQAALLRTEVEAAIDTHTAPPAPSTGPVTIKAPALYFQQTGSTDC